MFQKLSEHVWEQKWHVIYPRGIFNSHFDNGVINRTVFIFEMIVLIAFTRASWKHLTTVADRTCGFFINMSFILAPGIKGNKGLWQSASHHFNTWNFGKSHFGMDVLSREHFSMCTVQCCRHSGRWTFQHGNFSTLELFGKGNFRHKEFSANEHFGMGTFQHMDILAQ